MTACRACKSNRLYLFLPLGAHPLANGFLRKEQLAESEALFALDGYVCLDCGLIQIRDNVPANFFRNYVYVPSASEVMRAHFVELAAQVARTWLPSSRSLTVDIGCNDGLFLMSLNGHGVRTLGVDPATNIVERARQGGVEVVNEYFTPEVARTIKAGYGPATVIVTTNTFHHIDDLDAFTEGVTLLLEDTGVFIIEVPHASELVDQNQFDGIYHEHVSQFTVKAFVDLFRRFALEVVHIERLPVHGGSIRVFARKSKGQPAVSPVVSELLAGEASRNLFSAATYDAFRLRVERNRETLLAILSSLKRGGERVVGYGASARGNTLLNYCKVGPDLLDYIVDRNSLKHGLYSPGMHIPVVSVDRLLQDEPDFVLLIAWNFAEEIIRQLDVFAKNGGKFILPIPNPRVVDGAGGGRGDHR